MASDYDHRRLRFARVPREFDPGQTDPHHQRFRQDLVPSQPVRGIRIASPCRTAVRGDVHQIEGACDLTRDPTRLHDCVRRTCREVDTDHDTARIQTHPIILGTSTGPLGSNFRVMRFSCGAGRQGNTGTNPRLITNMLSLNDLNFMRSNVRSCPGGAEWDMAGSRRHDRRSHRDARRAGRGLTPCAHPIGFSPPNPASARSGVGFRSVFVELPVERLAIEAQDFGGA